MNPDFPKLPKGLTVTIDDEPVDVTSFVLEQDSAGHHRAVIDGRPLPAGAKIFHDDKLVAVGMDWGGPSFEMSGIGGELNAEAYEAFQARDGSTRTFTRAGDVPGPPPAKWLREKILKAANDLGVETMIEVHPQLRAGIRTDRGEAWVDITTPLGGSESITWDWNARWAEAFRQLGVL